MFNIMGMLSDPHIQEQIQDFMELSPKMDGLADQMTDLAAAVEVANEEMKGHTLSHAQQIDTLTQRVERLIEARDALCDPGPGLDYLSHRLNVLIQSMEMLQDDIRDRVWRLEDALLGRLKEGNNA